MKDRQIPFSGPMVRVLNAHQQQLLEELRALETRLAVQLKSMELISGMQRGCWFEVGRDQIERGLVSIRRAVQGLERVEDWREQEMRSARNG